MTTRILLLLSFLYSVACGSISAQGVTVINEGARLTHDGDDTYTLSWEGKAEPGRFYSVLTSDELMDWYFLPGAHQEAVNGTMGWIIQTTADRLFLKVETNYGILLSARCVPEEGIAIEIDISRWADTIGMLSIGQFVIERATSAEGPFEETMTIDTPLGWMTNYVMEFTDRNVEVGLKYYYRMHFGYVSGSTFHDSPPSNVASARVTCGGVAPGATLTASCRSDRIVLRWLRPDWAAGDEPAAILPWDWIIMRAEDPEGPFEPLPLNWYETNGIAGGMFVDTAVSAGKVYYYYATFSYFEAGAQQISPRSEVVEASIDNCSLPVIGPMDVVFIVDNTMSSGAQNALAELQSGIDEIVNAIINASGGDHLLDPPGGDYRLALVTTDANIVNVRLPFANENHQAFADEVRDLVPIEGNWSYPESTDECLNTVVNALSARHTPDEEQIGDFSPPFEAEDSPRQAQKIVVLITDDAPGGFDDLRNEEDWSYDLHGLRALGYAVEAREKGIRINAIMVQPHWQAHRVMVDYATTTCGWFSELTTASTGLKHAILSFIYDDPLCEL